MLFRQKIVEGIADALDGVALAGKKMRGRTNASVLVFHPMGKSTDAPLVEISLVESDAKSNVTIQSPLGLVELNEVEEVRLSESTREIAFFGKTRGGKLTMVTVSSAGVLQVYGNLSPSLGAKDLTMLAPEDLRAAIALKIFSGKSARPKKS
ncbi:MAG: hypothetical protein Q8916_02325 [Bacteroidota bacterium]|nr:hypothetical protein [Bacteroidota bacterium]MDP4229222.1 hypothetical protein [Bacteroidota bacterium]MDP4236059.1 hypothetical protein [Bacteroidota bacterium]